MSDEKRPEALVAFVQRRLQADMATQAVEPGARLSPTVLASEYGVSHIPVREALSSLAARGYITHKQSRGFFARKLSAEEFADIYHYRKLLETEAYRIAVPKITNEDIDKMRAITVEAASFGKSEDRLRYIELNRDFHFVAFERAGSPVLLHLLNYLWDYAVPYQSVDMVSSQASHDDHERQIALYKARDVEGVIEAMDKHRAVRQGMIKNSAHVDH